MKQSHIQLQCILKRLKQSNIGKSHNYLLLKRSPIMIYLFIVGVVGHVYQYSCVNNSSRGESSNSCCVRPVQKVSKTQGRVESKMQFFAIFSRQSIENRAFILKCFYKQVTRFSLCDGRLFQQNTCYSSESSIRMCFWFYREYSCRVRPSSIDSRGSLHGSKWFVHLHRNGQEKSRFLSFACVAVTVGCSGLFKLYSYGRREKYGNAMRVVNPSGLKQTQHDKLAAIYNKIRSDNVPPDFTGNVSYMTNREKYDAVMVQALFDNAKASYQLRLRPW